MSSTRKLLPRDLVVHRVDDLVLAYRIVKSIHPNYPVIVDSFRSNYELDAFPRGLEVESTLIHLGLSMYLKPRMAIATAQRWPQIGGHIAQFTSIATVHLAPNNGFCYANTAQQGHITVWGRPLQLFACIADILPVGD